MDGIILDSKSLNLPVNSAPELKERYQRFIDAINSRHPGNIYDEGKAFLECIFRTIIVNRIGRVDEGSERATFISLFEQAWDSLELQRDEFKRVMKKSVKNVGDFRNNYGAVSHGQDGYTERVLDEEEALFIARESLSIAAFFYSQHLRVSGDGQNERINYADNMDFNEHIDSQDNCEILGVVLIASEVLFANDPIAYREGLIEFRQMQESEESYYEDIWLDQQGDIMRGRRYD